MPIVTKKKTTTSPVTFESVLEKSNNKLWGCHFVVPAPVVDKLSEGSARRVVCTLNEELSYQCAMLPIGNGTFVISVNTSTQKKLGLKIGTRVQVSLVKDESRYGLPLPEEFAEVLRQDEDGKRLFQALTDGRKRTLLYIVGSKKNTDERIFRSLTIVKHLKTNNGVINYRLLNESLKKYSRT